MNEWINVKDRLPEKDCVCVVWNKNRPFQFYISCFSAFFQEFEINHIGTMIRLPDPVCFHATYWMPLPEPPKE